MSMPSYRDRQRAAIVHSARAIFAVDGLDGLQARRVARAADCSVGTIYNLFGNLDMIILSANLETLAELHDALLEAKHPTAGLDQQLDALAKAYLMFAVNRTPEWRALFEHRMAGDMDVPDWYREAQTVLFAIVEDLLRATIVIERSRSEAARALFSAVHGGISVALDEKLGAFNMSATERQVQFIVRSIARGLNDNHRD